MKTLKEMEELVDNILTEKCITKFLIEKIGWESLPKGWDFKSVKKFAKTLTKKTATQGGFFTECVKRVKGDLKNPEKFCAALKDHIWGTTKWRGGSTKKEKTGAEKRAKI